MKTPPLNRQGGVSAIEHALDETAQLLKDAAEKLKVP